ncbi:SMI1/KNR4 family protein [Streptomyces sp. V4-01]|uniref:SMI1/KNR4 family protein n=1 Tax=Actinacidiphila polyblastidii TaxID=3110430 RepID=A0ABU7PM31_9ACTN|nr:SMI1/KNR4 family protein [Streptomyces sp. V4-01]
MSDTEDVRVAWGRTVHWLAVHAPASARALRGPATDEDLAGLRAALGFDVPDVLETLLRMNNGSTAKDTTRTLPSGRTAAAPHLDSAVLPPGRVLLGCAEMAEKRAKWQSFGETPEDYWRACWIPVVHDFDGAYYGYVLDASGGAAGFPVLEFFEAGDPEQCAPSLGALLGSFADALELGRWGDWRAAVADGVLRWRLD